VVVSRGNTADIQVLEPRKLCEGKARARLAAWSRAYRRWSRAWVGKVH
jgi:hypothetical protein